MKLVVAILFALALVSANASYLRDPIPEKINTEKGPEVTDEQIVKELKKEAVNVETTELADGKESEANPKKKCCKCYLEWLG